MKKNVIRRSSILAVLISLFMVTLTACSSAKTVEEVKGTDAVVVKEEVAEVKTEVAETEPELIVEATVEATVEPTTEPTPEPVVYEGIDMQSTLPGKEWIKTFEGIIEEPKLVVFNDTTNKKIILENNQEVEFAADDIMAIYLPENTVLVIPDSSYIFTQQYYESPYIMEKVSEVDWKKGNCVMNSILQFNGEEITLSATLIFVD